MPKILSVNSNTHYGRGTPLTGPENRRNVRLAKYLLDLLVPGLPAYGYCDEDYGWQVPLTDEQAKAILARYPDSMQEYEYIYLSNGGKYADMLEIEFEGNTILASATMTEADDDDLKS